MQMLSRIDLQRTSAELFLHVTNQMLHSRNIEEQILVTMRVYDEIQFWWKRD